MDEITKEINKISDIQNNEEKIFKTKRLDKIDNLEKDKSEEKNVSDKTSIEDVSIKEEKKENIDKKNSKKKQKKNKKKKIFFIILGVVILLLIGITIIYFLTKKEPVKDTRSKYYKTIDNALDSGSLSDTFDKVLKDLDIDASSAELISIDINSDNKQDLAAYVESKESKYLLSFVVDGNVYYDDNYELTQKNSFGYAYSIKEKEAYWYTEYNSQYTVISDSKKIMNQDEFESNYYVITNKYNNIQILDNSEEYDLDKELDIDSLEKNKITKKKILNDNNLTLDEVKEKAANYIEEKLANEQKAEEEEQKKQEEEKKNTSVEVNGYTIKFGTYVSSDSKEEYSINVNNVASHTKDNVTDTCTWTIGKDTVDNDVIKVMCNDDSIDLYPTINGLKNVDGFEYQIKS